MKIVEFLKQVVRTGVGYQFWAERDCLMSEISRQEVEGEYDAGSRPGVRSSQRRFTNDEITAWAEATIALQAENERLRERMDYDKRKLETDITELLVVTQFLYWVEPESSIADMTASQARDRKKRAVDYYLARGDSPSPATQHQQVMFHSLITAQCQHIVDFVKQALKSEPKGGG